MFPVVPSLAARHSKSNTVLDVACLSDNNSPGFIFPIPTFHPDVIRSLSLIVASEFCRVPSVNAVSLFVPSATL